MPSWPKEHVPGTLSGLPSAHTLSSLPTPPPVWVSRGSILDPNDPCRVFLNRVAPLSLSRPRALSTEVIWLKGCSGITEFFPRLAHFTGEGSRVQQVGRRGPQRLPPQRGTSVTPGSPTPPKVSGLLPALRKCLLNESIRCIPLPGLWQ